MLLDLLHELRGVERSTVLSLRVSVHLRHSLKAIFLAGSKGYMGFRV